MINFVKSLYKRVIRRINYIGHLAVTEPTCGPDESGIIAKFVMIFILIFSSIFIEGPAIKILSILSAIFVICFILEEPKNEQK